MRIAILIGSIRPASNTAKAAAVVERALLEHAPTTTVDRIDPRALPMVVPGLPSQAEAQARLEHDLRDRISQADGVVLVTPEYDASYSAIMKILIEYLGYPSALAGKPITIVGVASGRIGAVRAIEQLRATCQGIGAIVLPTAPSIASVHQAFDAQGNCVDPGLDKFLGHAAQELCRYAALL